MPTTEIHARDFAPSAPGEAGDLPVLYLKSACPWCQEAAGFLDEHGVPHRRVDVTDDTHAREEMERLSGQTKVPTLDWHGEVLADFGLDELVPFLRSRNVQLEDS